MTDSPVTGAPTDEPTVRPTIPRLTLTPTEDYTAGEPTTDSTVAESPFLQTEELKEDYTVAEPPEEEEPIEDWATEVVFTELKPAPLTLRPSGKPTPKPTRNPTERPTKRPTKRPSNPPQMVLPPSTSSIPAPSQELMAMIGSILVAAESSISGNILVSIDVVTKEESPTKLYQYSGFINALGVMSKGDVGSTYFYLGPDGDSVGHNYGMANIALFLGQAASETIQFDVCDEISWEKDVFGRYPIANSCGQGRFGGVSMVPYEDANPCAEDEAHMACDGNVEMAAVAETHGIFRGAPPPLECFPRTATKRFTGAWDPSLSCLEDGCGSYSGQTMGNLDPLSVPTANSVSVYAPDWYVRPCLLGA